MDERPIREDEIEAFLKRGFRRYNPDNIDRLYINSRNLGLDCAFYDTGNIKYAEFNGQQISNGRAKEMRSAKTYVDVKTGRVFGDRKFPELKRACEELVEEILLGFEE